MSLVKDKTARFLCSLLLLLLFFVCFVYLLLLFLGGSPSFPPDSGDKLCNFADVHYVIRELELQSVCLSLRVQLYC